MRVGAATVHAAGGVLIMAVVACGSALATEKARAELKDRTGTVLGTVELTSTAAGTLIDLALKGVSPGAHAVHIHEQGRCEGEFASAGAIYNPLGAKHGLLNEDGPMSGDLPNVYASSAGEVTAQALSAHMQLGGEGDDRLIDDDGASIVLFERADDHMSDPEGNAGARIACGVLEIKK